MKPSFSYNFSLQPHLVPFSCVAAWWGSPFIVIEYKDIYHLQQSSESGQLDKEHVYCAAILLLAWAMDCFFFSFLVCHASTNFSWRKFAEPLVTCLIPPLSLIININRTKHSDRKQAACMHLGDMHRCTVYGITTNQLTIISIPISKQPFGMFKSGWLTFTTVQAWQPFCLLQFGFSVWVIIRGLITSHMALLIKMVSLLFLLCLCCLGVGLLDCRVHVRELPQGQTNEEEEEGGRETAVCA